MADNNPVNAPGGDAPGAAGGAAVNAASQLSLPAFWPTEPELWFTTVEAAFQTKNINTQRARYHHVVAKLPCETLVSVRDLLRAGAGGDNPYTDLRNRLCGTYGRSKWELCNSLHDHPSLGTDKPSVLMAKLQSLLPEGEMPGILFQSFFLRRLPEAMRQQLGAQDFPTAAAMATAADAIWAARGDTGTVFAATRDPSPGRSSSPRRQSNNSSGKNFRNGNTDNSGRNSRKPRGRSPTPAGTVICFYHRMFGKKAKKCENPCDWSEN